MGSARTILVVSLVSSMAVLVGCGGKSKPKPGAACMFNSECQDPLACTFGLCHEQCKQTRDCPSGERCVSGPNAALVCQLAKERGCIYATDCKDPLFCAPDEQCRNRCAGDRDCVVPGQTCVQGACAEPEDIDPGTGRLKLPAGRDAGAVAAGDGGAPDSSVAPGTDGATIGTDAPGSGGDGPAATADTPAGTDTAAGADAPASGDAGTTIMVEPGSTIGAAIDKAKPGDTIRIAPGQYMLSAADSQKKIPDNVSIVGAGIGQTTVMGLNRMLHGITFAGSGKIRDVAFVNLGRAIQVGGRGTVEVENVKASDVSVGVMVAPEAASAQVHVRGKDTNLTCVGQPAAALAVAGPYATVTVTDGAFACPGWRAVEVSAVGASVNLTGVTLTGETALWANSESDVKLSNATLNGAIFSMAATSKLTVADSTMTLNTMANGISFFGSQLTLSGITIESGSRQVETGGAGQIKVRNSKFLRYLYRGLELGASGKADLGATGDPGNLQFVGPMAGNPVAISDNRRAVGPPIEIVGMTWNMNPVPAQTVTMAVPGLFYFYANGNSIIVR